MTNEDLFQNYFSTKIDDEMFAKDGGIKSHWKKIKENIEIIGKEGLSSKLSDIKWHLAENGVTYNVYSEKGAHNRLWNLDPLPFVIDKNEWLELEPKLIQRAELLNFILKDLYGERKLIKSGLIPPEIIFSNKNFIRQADHIKYPSGKNLLFYAVDLARGPDGNMWAIGDKTGAPSGMGYALENRLTIGRTVPELYDGLHIKRLSNFFDEYKEFLNQCSPRQKENPFIVVLTPGPLNETYFEHAYLASFLGYPLVQGSDLVTRDNCVWLKSLKGLQLVDVIIKRVDDAYCDPLELKNDSELGVAGLLNAARKSNVTIVNPIGSTILENPALLPFLPNISKAIFGKDLMLHQVASWWCGQQKEMSYVLANLQNLIIRTIDNSAEIYMGPKLSMAQITILTEKIKQMPYKFVGQEIVSFSTAPTFVGDKVEPRNTLWRTFCISKKDKCKFMPGGLLRVAAKDETECISNQSGSGSKDVWILTSENDKESKQSVLFSKTKNYVTSLAQLPSLTAENLFWVGRYTSRALFTARFLRTLVRLISDSNHYEMDNNEKCKAVMCQALTHITMTYPGFLADDGAKMVENPQKEILSILLDRFRIGSLAHTILMLKNSNFAVRNLWSSDAWRVFDKIVKSYEEFLAGDYITLRTATSYLDELIMKLIAFVGLVEESIAREQGLVVYLLGSKIEESLLGISKTRAILTIRQNQQVEYELLESYLRSFESLNNYRYSYKTHLDFGSVALMMVFSHKYPKSLLYKLDEILKLFDELPKQSTTDELMSYEKMVFEAYSKLKLADFEAITDSSQPIRHKFDSLLNNISELLVNSSNMLSKAYFSHN